MTGLENRKNTALENYKEAKKTYLKDRTNENWISFCNAKTECMRLGVRI